jgi:hypothetical protein
MSTALTLLVLIASGEPSDPSAVAMARAARQALGADTEVIVRPFAPGAGDDEALAIARTVHADAVVALTWREADRRRVTLHVHADPGDRWIDRDIGFDASDADSERGRTIGFTVASMIPEREGAPPRPSPALADAAPEAPPAAAARKRFMVDAAFVGSAGIAGYAGGVGGSLHARWAFAPRFALRVGGSARAGEVHPAEATSIVMSGAIGAAWLALPPTGSRPLGLGLRADFLLLRHAIDRADEGAQARWMPGADLALEGSLRLADSFFLIAAGGGELAFGATDIFVLGRNVAAIPPARVIFEAGFRAEF